LHIREEEKNRET